MADVRKTVLEFLSQIGSYREVTQYLKEFSSLESSRFAVVKVGGGIIQESLDELASALAFLHKLGLCPVILHGAGPQVDAALKRAQIETLKRDNLRVTSDEVMAIARPVMYEQNMRIVEALEKRDIRARGIQHGTFKATFLDKEKYGLVGGITSVDISSIQRCVDSGSLPVLTCLAESDSGQMLNINADIATRELVWALKPHKIIFLTPSGGVLDQNNQLLSAINLAVDFESMMNADWVHSGMRLKLEQINELLNPLDSSASVSMTSAGRLTRELFTHRGAGTLIRKGEKVNVYEKPSQKTIDIVINLIEDSFDKKLTPQWFESLQEPIIILSSTYRGAGVIAKGQDGVPYLDKFIVTPKAQGEGLGAVVWASIKEHAPQLYWRSRHSNPITPWYFSQADSFERRETWAVFSIGIRDPLLRERLMEDALARGLCWSES